MKRTSAFAALMLCVACASAVPEGAGSELDADSGADAAVAPSVAPSRRGGAPAAWMPAAQAMVIFGGMDPITNDTFSFEEDVHTWRELSPEQQGALPASRCHHTLTEVPGADEALLFGGFSRGTRFNDTWWFDFAAEAWTELATSGDVPAKRCLHASVFVASRGELVMFGGISGGGNREGDFFGDTHVLDVSTGTWTRIEGEGPSAREGAVMFYSPALDAVYLWGGKAFDHYPTALWRFDVQAHTWSEIVTTGEAPTGREDPTHFLDESRNRLTIFSGRNDNDPRILFNDGYELEITTGVWSPVSAETAPPSRWRASVAVDPDGDRGLMFGGWRDFGGRDAFNDTWTYDLEARRWAEVPGP